MSIDTATASSTIAAYISGTILKNAKRVIKPDESSSPAA